MPGLVTSHINLNFRVIDKTGKQVDTGTIQCAGPGLTERESYNRAIELLFQKHSTEILKATKSNP